VDGVQAAERLSSTVQVELYHIAQEALNNTLKHASARRVRVLLQGQEPSVCLEISDDGAGFLLDDARKCGGFGLHGMAERAQRIGGQLHIDSAPGKGTTVRIEVPLGVAMPVGPSLNSQPMRRAG
jgi:signal transduction histidine kinase